MGRLGKGLAEGGEGREERGMEKLVWSDNQGRGRREWVGTIGN